MDGLLLTLLLGLFIVVGAFIVFLTKNNTKFIDFSIALAAGVIFMYYGSIFYQRHMRELRLVMVGGKHFIF